MQLEVIIRDANGKVTDMTGNWSDTDTASVCPFEFAPGSSIEAVVKNHKLVTLGTFYSEHAFSAKTVTATLFEDGAVAVTDDASNTYTRE